MPEQTEQTSTNTEQNRARKRTERLWNFGILAAILFVFLVAGQQGPAFAVMTLVVLCVLAAVVKGVQTTVARRRARQRPIAR